MSNYESVRVTGFVTKRGVEAPTIEAERFDNGRIEFTACGSKEVQELDPDWPNDPPTFYDEDIVITFDITKRAGRRTRGRG